MGDKYLNLVNSGFTKDLAKKLGLPRPVHLRRYHPGGPLVTGPVLVAGKGTGADTVASTLLEWGQDVRRHAGPKEKLGAIVLVLDGVEHPDDLAGPVLEAGAAVKGLQPGGRVVSISRPATSVDLPATAAARQGVDGFLRSVAHELRGGATANGILLADDVDATATSVAGALRFFLSGRSAYVDGQFLRVGNDGGSRPEDWERPLVGQVAVVTGAARGIGASIARTLRRDGADVVVVDVPAAGDHLAEVANHIKGTALQLDITGDDAGRRILDHAITRYGRLDIVIHNAGITRDKLLANMDEAKWKSVLAVNIAAQLRINDQLMNSGRFNEGPRIVSLASTSGIAGNRGQTNYATSKAGVIGMVRATAPLLEKHDGTINAVAPGFIETEMTARMPFATREVARRLDSLQQGGRPSDVAETVAFLSSSAAGGTSGQVLRVCGQNLVGA